MGDRQVAIEAGRGAGRGGEGARSANRVGQARQGLLDGPGLRGAPFPGEAGALEPLLWHYAYGKPKEVVDLTATTTESERDLTQLTDEELAQYRALLVKTQRGAEGA